MKRKEKISCVVGFVFLFCLFFEGKVACGCHTEYVHPLDGMESPCPLIVLKGRIIQHTFPGVPNYESIEQGDAPETRWVLIVLQSEMQHLREAGLIPNEFDDEECNWVQLISPHSENDPVLFINKEAIVHGYLGCLAFHVHTPMAIEAIDIYDNNP